MAGFNPWQYAEKSGKEHAHQTALFMWANMAYHFGLTAANDPESYTKQGYANTIKTILEAKKQLDLVPQLKWLHAIHNQGHGDKIRGGIAKAEGVKAGVFDIFLPVLKLNGFCAGLYLELKVGSNKPSPEQLAFASDMREAGYAAEIAWGWLEARDKILAYLGLTLPS